jgi:hypothetical protein
MHRLNFSLNTAEPQLFVKQIRILCMFFLNAGIASGAEMTTVDQTSHIGAKF